MNAYQWAMGYPAPKGITAKLAGAELERIRKANSGQLRPEVVVEYSRPKDAPLHAAFEWDDARAAHLHRCQLARSLIGAVVTIEVDDRQHKAPVRAFVHVKPKGKEPHYTSTVEAMSDAELRAQILGNALAELQSWRGKYDRLKELSRVYDAIDATVTGVEKSGQKRLAA